MTILSELKAVLVDMIPEGERPLVIHSAVWPIFREIGRADDDAVGAVLDLLLEVAGSRSVLMPTFTQGYINGLCDLDEAPAITGKLCEAFRRLPGVRRTKSAFFSFAVQGEANRIVCDLMPKDAWGAGSLYEWMELENARFLTLGVHPTHVSYLHRMEWLAADHIPYRYLKQFSGTLIHEAQRISCTETLYVRSLTPEAINDFTVLADHLGVAGMQAASIGGISVASYDAQRAREVVLPALRSNPLLVLANPLDFERHR